MRLFEDAYQSIGKLIGGQSEQSHEDTSATNADVTRSFFEDQLGMVAAGEHEVSWLRRLQPSNAETT